MNKTKVRTRLRRFVRDISIHTPFLRLVLLLAILWVMFSGMLYLAENDIDNSPIHSFADALYWGVAAFSTAGIANPPQSTVAQFIGALWIIVGSVLFFGAIVATVTAYFMRPMQGPHKRIIDTIEYNLEQLEDLTLEELDLLKDTVDTLITHVERLKSKRRAKSTAQK